MLLRSVRSVATPSLLLSLALLAVSAGLHASAAQEPPHEERGDCLECHMCINCHSAQGGATDITRPGPHHPLGVVYSEVQPRSRITLRNAESPSGFGATISRDLLKNGRIVCTTCHDGHDSGRDYLFRLRAEAQRDLCLACHILRR